MNKHEFHESIAIAMDECNEYNRWFLCQVWAGFIFVTLTWFLR